MSAVIAVVLLSLGVLTLESLRVVSKSPESAGWLRSPGLVSIAIVLLMAFLVGGLGFLARYFTTEKAQQPLEFAHWVTMAITVAASAFALFLLYRWRRHVQASGPSITDTPNPSKRSQRAP